MKNSPITIGDKTIYPGERMTIGLPTPEFYTYASMYMPIHIIHGKKKGPCLLVTAAIHGDEMNGIAIIHKLLNMRLLKQVQGTLILVPVVNVYGLISLTRNLPDRRDLDGSFPGHETGSFASRLAHYFSKEILSKATHCIDLHSPDPHQTVLSHVQTDLENEEAKKLAEAFQAPVILNNTSDRGLLWQNNPDYNIPTIIFEGGEILRLDDVMIRTGIRGIIRVMRALNMLSWKGKTPRMIDTLKIKESEWIRAPGSGLCELYKKVGAHVNKGDVIAHLFDPFGTERKYQIEAPFTGVILGKNSLSLINEGDFIYRIAKTKGDIDTDWKEDLAEEESV